GPGSLLEPRHARRRASADGLAALDRRLDAPGGHAVAHRAGHRRDRRHPDRGRPPRAARRLVRVSQRDRPRRLARAAGGTRSALAESGAVGGKLMPVAKELLALAEQIAGRLEARRESVAVAESSAGGLISAALLAVPGASAYFVGGGVVYTRAAKSALLRLDEAMLIEPRPATEAHAMIL